MLRWQILLPKDYLGYVLTSEPVTEPSVAPVFESGFTAMGYRYSQCPNISPALFPSVVESTWRLKKSEIAARVGPPAGLPMVAGGSDSAAAISLSISSSNLNRGSLGIGTSESSLYPYAHPPRSRRSGAFVLSCRWWILFAGSDVSGRWLCVGIEIHLRRIILTPS